MRRNFLVPLQSFGSWEELNNYLIDKCRKRRMKKAARKESTIGELFEEERESFLPLPETPFDACKSVSTKASSQSLARFKNNDYSVPVEYAHRDVTLKAYPYNVKIIHKDKVIAVHDRSFGRNDVVFDPLHYVPLLKRKPGAIDEARPFESWELPGCFDTFRRLLESRLGRPGTRDYIRVLQLLLEYTLPEVRAAIESSIDCGAINYESVKMILKGSRHDCFRTYPLSRSKLANLPAVRVSKQNVSNYSTLVSGGV
jgi:hypothetical protein